MKYKLVVFDVDGTLIDEQIWAKLHKSFGLDQDYNKRNIEKFRRKELEYDEWVGMDIGNWKKAGATKDMIKKNLEGVKLIEGALETIQELKRMGYKLAVVSGTLNVVFEQALPDYDKYFDYVFYNRILFDDDGNIIGHKSTPYDQENKAEALRLIAQKEGLSLSECVFVGDNFNDIEIAKISGFSIAFNCKSEGLAEVADVIVTSSDMRNILDYIHET